MRSKYFLIEIRATSVNPIDTKMRGQELSFSPNYPIILPVDFSGIVAEIPCDVFGFQNDSDAELSKKFGADYTINYKSTFLAGFLHNC